MAKWSGVVREGTGNGGTWKEASTTKHPPQEKDINTIHAGFRARKDAMHALDGGESPVGSDANIEDRKDGDEPQTEARPTNEENEEKEGVKEMPGREL